MTMRWRSIIHGRTCPSVQTVDATSSIPQKVGNAGTTWQTLWSVPSSDFHALVDSSSLLSSLDAQLGLLKYSRFDSAISLPPVTAKTHQLRLVTTHHDTASSLEIPSICRARLSISPTHRPCQVDSLTRHSAWRQKSRRNPSKMM